jgi:hypothetical protein
MFLQNRLRNQRPFHISIAGVVQAGAGSLEKPKGRSWFAYYRGGYGQMPVAESRKWLDEK